MAIKPAKGRRARSYRVMQRGQGMTEYIIIVALVAIAAIVAFTLFGNTMRSQLSGIAAELSGGNADQSIGQAKGFASTLKGDASTQKNMGTYNSENQNH